MIYENKVSLSHLDGLEAVNPEWAKNLTHLDADEGLIFARQLEYLEGRVYETKYPTLMARTLFSVDHSVPTGAKSFAYDTTDSQGAFNPISNYGDDLARVSLSLKRTVCQVQAFGQAVSYSIQDIRAAAMAGVPLDALQFQASRKQWEFKLDEIAMHGVEHTNIVGISDNLEIPGSIAAGASSFWHTKTPDEILIDLNLSVSAIIDLTLGSLAPDTIVMPYSQYQIISTLPRSALSDTTVLDFFLQSNPHVNNIIPWNQCKGAGVANTDVMFAYNRDPMALQLVIPQEYETFPPQEHNLAFNIPVHASTGGLKIRQPLSIHVMSGI